MKLQVFRLEDIAVPVLGEHAAHVDRVLNELVRKRLRKTVTQRHAARTDAACGGEWHLQHVLHISIQRVGTVRAGSSEAVSDAAAQYAAASGS